ncbi:MAG TPA: hypothetical protein VG291_09065 [Xanthobacteraceae bacterium]|jgi:hypothetical protein|nr:hypothetical protein [Xanthobacteraceae bacterium]
MTMDFNSYTGKQRSTDLIPNGTIAVLQIKVRPGGAGPGGWLKRSKNGDSEALDCELTVIGGPCDKRKLWDLILTSGTTDGQQQMAESNQAKICAILESARGIRPSDTSDAARQARCTETYGDFDGLSFIGKIGVERGGARPEGGTYPDKNKLLEAITPDHKAWQKPPGGTPGGSTPSGTTPSGTPSGAMIARPNWGR